jgi:hypothetical protein
MSSEDAKVDLPLTGQVMKLEHMMFDFHGCPCSFTAPAR